MIILVSGPIKKLYSDQFHKKRVGKWETKKTVRTSHQSTCQKQEDGKIYFFLMQTSTKNFLMSFRSPFTLFSFHNFTLSPKIQGRKRSEQKEACQTGCHRWRQKAQTGSMSSPLTLAILWNIFPFFIYPKKGPN